MASATTIKDPENMACCLRGIVEGLRNFTGALEAYVSALEADSTFLDDVLGRGKRGQREAA